MECVGLGVWVGVRAGGKRVTANLEIKRRVFLSLEALEVWLKIPSFSVSFVFL